MAFFMLVPAFWIASILIYAASPRQQINKQRQQALLTPSTAWTSFGAINIACFVWLILSGWSVLVVAVNILLLNMLMIPASIIFLAHHPDWLKRVTFSKVGISIFAQLLVQGYAHVA